MLPIALKPSKTTINFPFALINFHEISEPEQFKLHENSILQENNLFRLVIPRCHIMHSNIFRIISYSLYMTTLYEKDLRIICIEGLKRFMDQSIEKIPRRLRVFYNNQQLFYDFSNDPLHPKYNLLVLDIISWIFQTKIMIYEIDDNQYMRSLIINNFFEPQIMLFRDRFGQFDCLESYVFMMKFKAIKKITIGILDRVFDLVDLVHKRKESDVLFDELNRDIENEINTHLEKAKALSSSSSIDFDSKTYKTTTGTTNLEHTAEKQRNDQFFSSSIASLKDNLMRSMRQAHIIEPVHVELFTPNPKLNFGKKINKAPSLAMDKQEGSNNPFNIETIQGNLKESPTFNENPLIRPQQEEVLIKPKKLKNVTLKCTSEEFFIPVSMKESKKLQLSPPPQNQILKKQPLVLEESKDRYLGTVKFFDDNKGYGFIIMDIDNTEIFVHYDDFDKSQCIQKEMLMSFKLGNIIRVSFTCMKYIGKYNMSRKAVDVHVLSTSF